MRITAIRAENFLRIREIDVPLVHPITLFCGENDVGKTSMQDAIRLAFLREATRVKLKKHWSQLVRNGAKNAAIIIDWTDQPDKRSAPTPGRAAIALPSGDGSCTPEPPAALAFALDAPRFAALDEDKGRRKFLFDLIGVKVDVASVKGRLLERSCRLDLVEQVVPILRTGFDAAHNHAVDKQKEFRGAWVGITGEDYGHKKAETWRSALTASEFDRAMIANLQDSITNISSEIKDVTRQVGAGEAYLSNKSRYDREAKGLKDQANQVARRKKDMDDAERALTKSRGTLETDEAKLTDARLTGQPCPECGVVLCTKADGKLIASPAVGKKELAALEASVDDARKTVRICQETFTKAKADYDAAVKAAETLAQLENAMGGPTTPERLDDLRKQAAELEHEVESLTSKLADAQNTAREIEKAKKATQDAKVAHQLVQSWGAIAESLAPDGIPGDLLAEALGPMNKRLKKSAEITDWPAARIENDMTITVGGILYSLCGESVRWRADAMLAEAISNAAGVKMLVLDRLDVLHPQRRQDALNWFDHLVEKDGYETIIACATLKAKPALDGVNVFWLEDGKV